MRSLPGVRQNEPRAATHRGLASRNANEEATPQTLSTNRCAASFLFDSGFILKDKQRLS
jgi:hypothetical protein